MITKNMMKNGERLFSDDPYEFFKSLSEEEINKSIVVLKGKTLDYVKDDEIALIIYNEERDKSSFEDDFGSADYLYEIVGGESLDEWFAKSGVCYTDWCDCLVLRISKDDIERAKEIIKTDELVAIATSEELIVILPNDLERGFDNAFELTNF